jgi:hypothetical protein
MDRDDHALSLTESAHDDTRLTERARLFKEALKWACLNIQSEMIKGGKKRPLCITWAAHLAAERSIDLSGERLRKWYDAWTRHGDAALVNKSLCGKPQARLIPAKIVQQFWGLYLDMKDKASKDMAWRNLMERFIKGERMEGGLTWPALFLTLHPTAEIPEHCPWNLHNPPPGWTRTNFTSQPEPDEVTTALALRGMGGAKAVLSKLTGVRIDWATLRIGECYMIDDVDGDFHCIVDGQIVRLRLIVLIEVRSRRVLAYVVRPRTTEDDGTMRSITRRDVQHLLAGWLWKFGLPRDYESTLHMENASATTGDAFNDMLGRVTGGRLGTHKTAVYDHVVKIGGYREHGGTPTGKPQIESKFRLFHTYLAHVRGWTGRNYLTKPGEHEDRKIETKKLMNRAALLPEHAKDELAAKLKSGELKLPFMSLWEAHEEIGQAFAAMDRRMWHEMEGFLRVREFRMAEDSGIYYPLNAELLPLQNPKARETIKDFLESPKNWQTRYLAWGRERAESSAECWTRLAAQEPWVKISENAMFELLLDHKQTEWNGTGSVRIDIGGRMIEFRPQRGAQTLSIATKSKVLVRYNEDAPELAVIQDHAGRVLGSLIRSDRTHYHDLEGKREQAEFKAVTLAHAIQNVQVFQSTNPDSIREIDERSKLAAFMDAFEGEHAAVKPEATIQSGESDALVNAMQMTGEEERREKTDRKTLRELRKAANL